MTPAAQEHGLAALNRARSLTERFNSLLSEILDEIEVRFSLRFYRLDVWEMAERARGEPAAFGFADVTTPCHGLPSCDGYLFWDSVHPTAEAHARLAEASVRLIAHGPSSRVEKGRTGGD